ncbi:hypothetical protein BVRB_9g208030 [Beta vulgaris subsp. vulgaris]|nr:hypothetical protein BVRB_9g208030 [Beta vulgaris subsp. vulgaris]
MNFPADDGTSAPRRNNGESGSSDEVSTSRRDGCVRVNGVYATSIEEGYDVSKLHKTPQADPPLEDDEGPKDTSQGYWRHLVDQIHLGKIEHATK